ncbi:cyclase family protein [Pseudonocardia nematodicida]|uniref:Cyclase family protein n=1 Tax=Pseudonocardia nematodicida TaxID=1206997 RepID=A0ABV1K8R7_9PSEU
MDQAALSAALSRSTLVELGRTLYNGMPSSPNHPGFKMALMRRHGDAVRADGSSAANEIIVTGGHVGTHVDALAHVSYEGCLHGGVDAARAQTGGRFSSLGADEVPPMLGRGLFFDIATARDTDVLPGGYGVTADDLSSILDTAGIEPRAGDVAVVRTGWGRYWDDPERYAGHASGVPGVSLDAAEWLVAHGFRAVGTDTTACEQLAPGAGHSLLPVHKVLLVDAGIHILEHLALEDLAATGIVEFSFVMAPLRIVGATGSPIRPLAVVVG